MNKRIIKGDINHVFKCGMNNVKEKEGIYFVQVEKITKEQMSRLGTYVNIYQVEALPAVGGVITVKFELP